MPGHRVYIHNTNLFLNSRPHENLPQDADTDGGLVMHREIGRRTGAAMSQLRSRTVVTRMTSVSS